MEYLVTLSYIGLLIASLFILAFWFPFHSKGNGSGEMLIKAVIKLNGIAACLFILSGFLLFDSNVKIDIFQEIKITINQFNLISFSIVVILLTIISEFSFRYLHKEQGFHKFFLNILLFWFGLFLFIFSSTNMLMFAGWEFIGISSIFLISYYSYRRSPVLSSLYVMSFYKFADIALLAAILFLDHGEVFSSYPAMKKYVWVLIVIAGAIKSASFPFTSWLPRAMEGPTPSSAIFYVALSVNTGVLLIMKFWDQIALSPLASNLVLGLGIMTLLYCSFQNRVQSDVKSTLAYSALMQIGVIYIELYFGFVELAYVHLIFSTFVKTYQFLKTPSLLHLYHSSEGEFGKVFTSGGTHFQFLVPKKVRVFLYYISLNHFYIDFVFDKIGAIGERIGALVKGLLYPIVESKQTLSYKSLMWWIYFLIATVFINFDIIKIGPSYLKYSPVILLFLALGILNEKKTSSLISFFFIYKVLEVLIIHGTHNNLPLKYLYVASTGIFAFLIIFYMKIEKFNFHKKKIFGSFLLFSMLFFTNFPFLLQSVINEHIIDTLISHNQMGELLLYGLANTTFNIGLFNFVFNEVYIREAKYS